MQRVKNKSRFLFLCFILSLINMNLTPKVVNAKKNTKYIKTHKAKYKDLCKKYELKMMVDKKREKKINKDFDKLGYTFKDPYINLNPFKRTPLSAIIKFKTKNSEKIKIYLKNDDDNFVNILNNGIYKKNHEYIINWLYPNKENELLMEGLNKNDIKRSVNFNIKTSKIKNNLPFIVNQNNDRINRSETKEQKILLSFMHEARAMAIINSRGEYRWVLQPLEMSHTVLKYKNNFILSNKEINCLIKVDYLGRIIKIYDLGEHYFHHDMKLVKDNIFILTTKIGIDTVQDQLIEYNLIDSKLIKEWDFRKYFKIKKSKGNVLKYISDKPVNDWIHLNSVFYHEHDKSIIVSGRYKGITKISYKGDLIWNISKDQNILKKRYLNKILKPVNNTGEKENNLNKNERLELTDFIYPVGQHSALMISDKHMFFFNNNGTAPSRKINKVSSGIIYKIDEEKNKVKIIESLGEDEGVYSYFISSVDYKNNNKLIMFGHIGDYHEKKVGKLIEYNENNIKINEMFMIGEAHVFSAKYF